MFFNVPLAGSQTGLQTRLRDWPLAGLGGRQCAWPQKLLLGSVLVTVNPHRLKITSSVKTPASYGRKDKALSNLRLNPVKRYHN